MFTVGIIFFNVQKSRFSQIRCTRKLLMFLELSSDSFPNRHYKLVFIINEQFVVGTEMLGII
jgi:hypothetical protein